MQMSAVSGMAAFWRRLPFNVDMVQVMESDLQLKYEIIHSKLQHTQLLYLYIYIYIYMRQQSYCSDITLHTVINYVTEKDN